MFKSTVYDVSPDIGVLCICNLFRLWHESRRTKKQVVMSTFTPRFTAGLDKQSLLRCPARIQLKRWFSSLTSIALSIAVSSRNCSHFSIGCAWSPVKHGGISFLAQRPFWQKFRFQVSFYVELLLDNFSQPWSFVAETSASTTWGSSWVRARRSAFPLIFEGATACSSTGPAFGSIATPCLSKVLDSGSV